MKDNNFLRFLFDSRYRVWRHLLFILVGGIITFNQVFIAYQDSQSALGNRIYIICAASFMLYLTVMYFNYFYLTPRYLMKEKYAAYIIVLLVIVFALPTLSVVGEYYMRTAMGVPHRITSYANPLILVDNLSTAIITAICFCGVSAVMFFRKWVEGNEEVNRLKEEHIKSELNKLKGQIAPAFLSRTLRNASRSAESKPGQTSAMLMQLGRLLRYQLYDCNRDRILLKSEINALNMFFELEQYNNPAIRHSIHIDGNINNAFVSPMLFMSLVQCVAAYSTRVELFFRLSDETLSFICRSDSSRPLDESDAFTFIRQRLALQYPDKHSLTVNGEMIELNIDIL
jgi:hypothetical protein